MDQSLSRVRCAAERGATRRSATSSTSIDTIIKNSIEMHLSSKMVLPGCATFSFGTSPLLG